MPLFRNEPSYWDRLDWRLLQNGSVVLYHRRDLLDEDLGWLSSQGYASVTILADSWLSSDDLHDAFAAALGFPEYYGKNFNALVDCLGDLEITSEGLVIVLKGFDSFARREPHTAAGLLDILDTAARRFLLFGERLLTILQSDDRHIQLQPVGATSVTWNPREWTVASRTSRPAS